MAKKTANLKTAPKAETKPAIATVEKIAAKAGAKLAPKGKVVKADGKGKVAPAKAAPFQRRFKDEQKLVWVGDNGKVNPRSPNTKDPKNSPHARYAAMMASKTVGEAIKRGAWSGTIARAVKEGRLAVK